jgi:hypothetical protein
MLSVCLRGRQRLDFPFLSAAAAGARREAQDVAAPSLGLATAVLAFLGFAFSGVEGSSAGGFDLNFQVAAGPTWIVG